MNITLNIALLGQMVDEKLISVEKHPEADLFIYNYSQRVQYDKLWNEATLQARGLILDSHYNIVARPFRKFFNFEEVPPQEIPHLPFEVFEKLDGSLGILYFIGSTPQIATRGSFVSDQAQYATRILHKKYAHLFSKLRRDKTYLFEIIFPANRIVVDYGELDDIILLTVIDNETGEEPFEESLEDIGFPIVHRFDGIRDIQTLRQYEESNKEGFVIRFQNNLRLKVKFREYVRLHRIITGTSNVAVWEYLKEGKSFEELLEKVPDEFFAWVSATKNALEQDHTALCERAVKAYSKIYSPDRKEFALRVMAEYRDISSLLFNLHSGKSITEAAWKMVRPKYNTPYFGKIEV